METLSMAHRFLPATNDWEENVMSEAEFILTHVLRSEYGTFSLAKFIHVAYDGWRNDQS